MAAAVLATPGRAQEHGLLLHGDGGLEPAPVLGSIVHIRAQGLTARATVTQIFENPGSRTAGAVYVFPLPESAAVDSLRMAIGDRVVEGTIATLDDAREIYATAAAEGRKAARLEAQRPNVFTASVTGIGPGEVVEIEIGLGLTLDYDLGTFRLAFPLVVAPRFPGADVSSRLLEPPRGGPGLNPTALRVDLAGVGRAVVSSPSHAIRTRETRGGLVVEPADEVVPADRDFVLEWTPEAGRVPRASAVVEEVDGERYALVTVLPPAVELADDVRLPREAVLVIDVSGSMAGEKLEQAREALLLALDAMRPGDRLLVLSFSDETEGVGPVDVDAASLDRARRFVRGLEDGGGTKMMPALERALRTDGRSGLLRQVVFVTDGQVQDEDALFQYIRHHLDGSRLFTVAIGAAPNAHFMRRAAELGRGTFTAIDDPSKVAEGMGGLLRHLGAPMLQDVELDWDGTADVRPRRVPDLYLGKPLVVTARVGSAREVTVRGWLRDRPFEVTVPLPEPTEAGGAGIAKLWARRRIDDLLVTDLDPEERRRQVTRLALDHGLVTSYTALVTVDEVSTVDRSSPISHLLPVNAVGGGYYEYTGTGVEEVVTVTAESPLLDARRITTGTSIPDGELERIPSAPDPWQILIRMPGVLRDRVTTIGTEAEPGGGAPHGARWSVDGVDRGALDSVAIVPREAMLLPVDEVTIVTAGGEASSAHATPRLDLVTDRGTNQLRAELGASHAVPTDDSAGRTPADDETLSGLALGGPVVADRFWSWASYRRLDSRGEALGGTATSTDAEAVMAKVNAELGASTAVEVSGSRAESMARGVDAGPGRTSGATLDHDAVHEAGRLQSSVILSSNAYLHGRVASSDGEGSVDPRADGLAVWTAADVLRGGGRRLDEERRSLDVGLDGVVFFQVGPSSHELDYGGRSSEVEDRSRLGFTDVGPAGLDGVRVDGARLGLVGDDLLGGDLFWAIRPGSLETERRSRSLWLQDKVQWSRFVLTAGLRADDQGASLEGRDTIRWRTVVPRLAASVWLDADHSALVRLAWGRYASPLGRDAAGHASTVGGEALFRLDDDDPALLWSDGFTRPGIVDDGLEAPTVDELTAGVELEPYPGYGVLGLRWTGRRAAGLLERRDLVLGAEGLRPALADDYVLDHRASGSLADGAAYEVPVYTLRPGLEHAGATLLTNGDDELRSQSVVLDLKRPLRWRWGFCAQLRWGEARHRLGPASRRHLDPTDLQGPFDDGGLHAEPSGGGLGSGPWTDEAWRQSGWSASLEGAFRIVPDRPWTFDLGLAVHAREGDPLPWTAWDATSPDGVPRRLQLTTDTDSYRLDDVTTVDLRLSRETELVGDLSAVWSLDIRNVTDEDAATRRELALGPRRGEIEATVPSRAVVAGVRLRWN